MRTRYASIYYLVVLAAAALAWFPLYPFLFALTSDQRLLPAHFLHHQPAYIYFADSVIATNAVCEKDHRSIAQMLPPVIADRTMLFSSDGGNAHLWRDVALFIAAHNHGTVAAVIPINMGVFSPGWEHNPDYAFEQDGMLFNLASGRTSVSQYWNYLIELHSPFRLSRRRQAAIDQSRMPVMVGPHSIGSLGDVAQRLNVAEIPCGADPAPYAHQLRLRFDINYGVRLTPADPYFTDLDETITRLKEGGVRPIVYITPLNFDDVGRFGGRILRDQLEANVALVRQIARQRGWNIIDLSSALSSEHFITRECACEHVDAFGRGLIARNVAAAMQGNRREGNDSTGAMPPAEVGRPGP